MAYQRQWKLRPDVAEGFRRTGYVVRHPFLSTCSETKGLPLSIERIEKLPDTTTRFLDKSKNLETLISHRAHATSKKKRGRLLAFRRRSHVYLESRHNHRRDRVGMLLDEVLIKVQRDTFAG